jgi:hypothetical protein
VYGIEHKIAYTEKRLDHSEKRYHIQQNKASRKYNKYISILLATLSFLQAITGIYELLTSLLSINDIVSRGISFTSSLLALAFYVVWSKQTHELK